MNITRVDPKKVKSLVSLVVLSAMQVVVLSAMLIVVLSMEDTVSSPLKSAALLTPNDRIAPNTKNIIKIFLLKNIFNL